MFRYQPRTASPSGRLGKWHLAGQAQKRLARGPLFVVDDDLAANAVLGVDHQGSLKVAGEPVADLVADHEDLREARVGELDFLLGLFLEGKVIVLEEDGRIGHHEREGWLVHRLQPEEVVFFPGLDQREALMLRKAQEAVRERDDSFLVDLQASKTCRRDIHANSISYGRLIHSAAGAK